MFVFFKIIKTILFENEIIFLNSPLQFLNYLEYVNKNSFKGNILRKKKILFGYTFKDKEHETILHLFKILKVKNTYLLNLKKNISTGLFLKIVNFRGIIFKYKKLIIGDYHSFVSTELYKASHQVVMLDDGTNSLHFNRLFNLDRKKLEIFSFFKKSVFNHKKIEFNNFSYLKSFLKRQYLKNYIILLGSADVEKNLIKFKDYSKILKKIKKKNFKRKILYLPHPKEKYENYSNYGFQILKTKKIVETYLVFEKSLPKKIIGFNSTAFVTIHAIYGNKIKLINYSLNSNYKYNKWLDQYLKNHYKKIKIYFKKIIGISTTDITFAFPPQTYERRTTLNT